MYLYNVKTVSVTPEKPLFLDTLSKSRQIEVKPSLCGSPFQNKHLRIRNIKTQPELLTCRNRVPAKNLFIIRAHEIFRITLLHRQEKPLALWQPFSKKTTVKIVQNKEIKCDLRNQKRKIESLQI